MDSFFYSARSQSGVNNSSSQILDLTRPPATSHLLSTSGNYSPCNSSNNDSGQATFKADKSQSKIEQTEPMDFSSSQTMPFSTRGLEASTLGRNNTSSDFSRFRTSSEYSCTDMAAFDNFWQLLAVPGSSWHFLVVPDSF